MPVSENLKNKTSLEPLGFHGWPGRIKEVYSQGISIGTRNNKDIPKVSWSSITKQAIEDSKDPKFLSPLFICLDAISYEEHLNTRGQVVSQLVLPEEDTYELKILDSSTSLSESIPQIKLDNWSATKQLSIFDSYLETLVILETEADTNYPVYEFLEGEKITASDPPKIITQKARDSIDINSISNWLKNNQNKYVGQWVALGNKGFIDSDSNRIELQKKINPRKSSDPTIIVFVE